MNSCITRTIPLLLLLSISPIAQPAAPTGIPPASATPGIIQADAGRFGTLHVVTNPESALVILDSIERGRAPLTINNLVPGEHFLQFKKKGHFIKKVAYVIHPDSAETLMVVLLKPCRLAVTSNPDGADVNVNGQKTGTTPWVTEKMVPGEYQIVVGTPGYQSGEKRIVLATGGADSLHFNLIANAVPESTLVKPLQAGPASTPTAAPAKVMTFVSLGVFVLFSLVVLVVELTRS